MKVIGVFRETISFASFRALPCHGPDGMAWSAPALAMCWRMDLVLYLFSWLHPISGEQERRVSCYAVVEMDGFGCFISSIAGMEEDMKSGCSIFKILDPRNTITWCQSGSLQAFFFFALRFILRTGSLGSYHCCGLHDAV